MAGKSSRRSKKKKDDEKPKLKSEENFDVATKDPSEPDTGKVQLSSIYEEETQDDIKIPKKLGLATAFVNRIYLRVRQIKENNPNIAAEIDMNEWYIKEHMRTIRTFINQLPEDDRELVTILVIAGLHQLIDDVLVIDPDNLKDEDAREVDTRTRKLRLG